MRRPYVLAGREFPTKVKIEAVCHDMLDGRTPLDDALLLDLLGMHHEREQKIGAGVRRFYVAPDGFGGRCFWLERVDGTTTDWSFRACLKPPTHEQEVRAALRRIVAGQVIAFRDSALATAPRCAITGAVVTVDTAHVDHKPPKTFLALVEAFLVSRASTYADVAIIPTADSSTVTELADAGTVAAWTSFHAREAVLQLTSARANLSQGSGDDGARRRTAG